MAVARDSILELLQETDGRSELYDGVLREKPPMSSPHNHSVWVLTRQLARQLPDDLYDVRINGGHLAIPGGHSYIPDVFVLPIATFERATPEQRRFERYAEPMPFVVEVWSPSTGTYDVDRKIPGYRERGDLEIWCVHPFERTVHIWRRQADGSYAESLHREGSITLHALPQVTIDLDPLFVSE